MLDPKTMKDWQIAEAAEATMKPVKQLAEELGLAGEGAPALRPLRGQAGLHERSSSG